MQFIDRVVLSWYGPAEVAAAMPAGMLAFGLAAFFIGAAGYVGTFVAHAVGAGRPREVGGWLWQGIWLALAGGALLLLPALWARPLFAAIGHAPEVQAREVTYFAILAFGQLPALLSVVLSSFWSGRGQTWVVAVVNGGGALLNAALAYALVLGTPWSPAYGIAGAGWATVIANFAIVGTFVLLLLARKFEEEYAVRSAWRFDTGLFRQMMKFGTPSGIHFMVDIAGFNWLLMTLGRIGEVELAASNMAFQIELLGLLPLIGIGVAVSIAVGQYQGGLRSDRARRATFSAVRMSLAYAGGMALVVLVAPDLFLWPFRVGADPAEFAEIFPLARTLLRFTSIYLLFDALVIAWSSALKGAGDTRFVMAVIGIGSCFGLGLLPMAMASRWGFGIVPIWWELLGYMFLLWLVFRARFLSGAWKGIRVLG
jgi:MATE family multidrug resistance protein